MQLHVFVHQRREINELYSHRGQGSTCFPLSIRYIRIFAVCALLFSAYIGVTAPLPGLMIDEACLVQVYSSMEVGNAQEAYNDAKQLREEAGSLFKLGCLSLEQRAQAEALYDCVSQQMLTFAPQLSDELRLSLAATYHVNLSVFRSAPDSWAINQIFPIMPLHRLTEKPTTLATLADLTCDSDGKIDRFVGASGDISSVLPVHDLHEGEPYYLGLFLGGVYQVNGFKTFLSCSMQTRHHGLL